MRGKRRGNAENHIIMQAGVASIVSSWLSSPPVASNAGWKPAHPGSGEQPAGCAGCGLEARAPWQFRQDAAGIDTRCIQIEHKNVSRASPPQQNNAEQSEQPSPFQQNRQCVEQGEDAHQRKKASNPYEDT